MRVLLLVWFNTISLPAGGEGGGEEEAPQNRPAIRGY